MAKYKLDELCEFITDGTHQTPEYCEKEGIIFLSSKDVTERKIDWNNVKYIPVSLHEKLCKRLKPRKNDILLAKNGTTGVAAIVDRDEFFDVYVSLAVLRPLDNIYPRYLLYAINSPVAKKQFDAGLKGIGVPNLHLGVIRETVVNIVPRNEQEKICEILDRVENVINERKQELIALDNLIKGRFVELFGDLADPKCLWSRFKLVDVCTDKDDIKCGPFGTQLNKDEYQKSGIAVWEIPQINASFLTQPTHFLTKEKAEQLKAYTIIPGDIAMSRKGNVGKCALFPDDYPEGIIHSDVLRIRVDHNKVNPLFLMCQLHFSRAVTRQIEMVSSGAIMAGVNVTKLKQIYIHLPPLEYQEKFAGFVRKIGKSKVAVQKALEETQLLFDSLMQQYFG